MTYVWGALNSTELPKGSALEKLVDPVPVMHGKVILHGRKMPNLMVSQTEKVWNIFFSHPGCLWNKVGMGKNNKDHQQTAQIAETALQVTVLFTYFHLNAEDLTFTLVIDREHHDQLLV